MIPNLPFDINQWLPYIVMGLTVITTIAHLRGNQVPFLSSLLNMLSGGKSPLPGPAPGPLPALPALPDLPSGPDAPKLGHGLLLQLLWEEVQRLRARQPAPPPPA